LKSSLTLRDTADHRDIPLADTFRSLETTDNGISEAEARRRLQLFGANEVAERKRNAVAEFLKRYWGPMPWLLELAIVLSVAVAHYLEAGIIFLLLAINTVVGQIQSRGSQRALDALRGRLAIKARVLRDGKWATISAREIVPGDVVSVGLGDIIPADARLLSGNLSVDQSALTGESLPADVQPDGIIFSGSIVGRGEARCVVVNTGATSYFGKTAELVRIAAPKSHQEQVMLDIVRYMMYLGVGALILVAISAAVLGTGFMSILTFAVIFLMGAVPVALPAVLAIVQSVGSLELAHKGVLVTRLNSIEDAASIDIICLDKTGTITQNQLSVGDIVPFGTYSRLDVAVMASLASQGQQIDAIDAAVLEYADKNRLALDSYRQLSFTPFQPSTKRSEALAETEGKMLRAIKGAPQTVLSLCSNLDDATKTKADKTVEELSLKGYRTIGVARSVNEGPIDFVGLVALADPPRPDSREMIDGARRLGVRPIMLTGDNIAIAREIAEQVSIGDRIVRMDQFRSMGEADQTRIIDGSDGFAEIYPEDKYSIVRLLQSHGHMVGMTGDGVNDAPALKQAELGIAVSNSTDVAKAAASMVLTEPGVGVVVEAIKTSRYIYQRMLTWVINKVTKVVQVVGVLTLGFFWFHDAVISLLGMALLVFANDFVTMSLATDNVQYTASPDKWDVLSITFASLITGALLVGEGAIALLVGSRYFELPFDQLQTFMMLTLVFTSQFRVYIVRERRYFWSSRPGRELMIATIGTLVAFAFLGVSGFIVPAVTPAQMIFALGLSAVFTLAVDVPKRMAFRAFGL
jgi:H+-transporting ATPase